MILYIYLQIWNAGIINFNILLLFKRKNANVEYLDILIYYFHKDFCIDCHFEYCHLLVAVFHIFCYQFHHLIFVFDIQNLNLSAVDFDDFNVSSYIPASLINIA